MGLSLAFKIFLGATLFGALTLALPLSPRDLSGFMLTRQDLPVLAAVTVLLFVLLRWQPRVHQAAMAMSPPRVAAASAILVSGVAYAGAHFAALHFPLSMDEFMVVFDAAILREGSLVAPLDPAWRPLRDALQPIFQQSAAEAVWSSSYLPVNAALHAVFLGLGDYALTAPLLAAVAILSLYDVAKRLWPGRPDAAIVAVLLLATSSQFVVTAMTPYAMTAHLAFNLLWLALFLRNTAAAHAGALLVGFAASGLHQVVFHPLFVAPFVLGLWLERRFRAAAVYTIAYGAICLFWMSYWGLVLPESGADSSGLASFLQRAVSLLNLDPGAFAYMARNLARLLSWQNPAMLVLFILACRSIRRWPRPLPHLLAGIVLTLVFVAIILPYQGHGWGYRYLHGLLGSISLIAAYGWTTLSPGAATAGRGVFVACTVFALAALPVRAWQMHAFARPYAAAYEEIRTRDSDIVLVDPTGIWFGGDLVRNDPYLRNRPKVMVLNHLDEAEISDLCRRYSIVVFDGDDADRFGIRIVGDWNDPRNRAMRAFLDERACAAR